MVPVPVDEMSNSNSVMSDSQIDRTMGVEHALAVLLCTVLRRERHVFLLRLPVIGPTTGNILKFAMHASPINITNNINGGKGK